MSSNTVKVDHLLSNISFWLIWISKKFSLSSSIEGEKARNKSGRYVVDSMCHAEWKEREEKRPRTSRSKGTYSKRHQLVGQVTSLKEKKLRNTNSYTHLTTHRNRTEIGGGKKNRIHLNIGLKTISVIFLLFFLLLLRDPVFHWPFESYEQVENKEQVTGIRASPIEDRLKIRGKERRKRQIF